jgi:serine phosphatase RsbU (regulator of sigma subunit)
MQSRTREVNPSDIAEITLMSPGDIVFLYTDGVFDGSDEQQQQNLEAVMRNHYRQSAKEICAALMDCALKNDEALRQRGEDDVIDDKTVFIIKRG